MVEAVLYYMKETYNAQPQRGRMPYVRTTYIRTDLYDSFAYVQRVGTPTNVSRNYRSLNIVLKRL